MNNNEISEAVDEAIGEANGSAIAAISTPDGQGGLATVRISGISARLICAQMFAPRGVCGGYDVLTAEGYTAAYGQIYDADGPIDEGVLLVFAAPHSYTGEDVCELTCHGGTLVAQKVLRAALAAGAQAAAPGEFSKRAFLNGKLGLTAAEAIMDIISAEGEQALRLATATHRGDVSRETSAICDALTDTAAKLAVWADFPEDDLPVITQDELLDELDAAAGRLTRLCDGYFSGQRLRRGLHTVIAGKPNVGKSSLLNLLAGRPRAIVTGEAGTTRDIIEEQIDCGGLTLRLADTAGIHEAGGLVERIGIERAMCELEAADIVLLVLDGSRPLDDDDLNMIDLLQNRENTLVLVNKSDLKQQIDLDFVKFRFTAVLNISADLEVDRDRVVGCIRKLPAAEILQQGGAVLQNERQYGCAKRALTALNDALAAVRGCQTFDAAGVMLDEAIACLLELDGRAVSAEVINRVFEQFCIGK